MKISDAPQRNCLTIREAQILQRIAAGDTAKQIAERLDMNYHNVRNARNAVIAKLGASNSTHAVVIALHHDMIKLPSDAVGEDA